MNNFIKIYGSACVKFVSYFIRNSYANRSNIILDYSCFWCWKICLGRIVNYSNFIYEYYQFINFEIIINQDTYNLLAIIKLYFTIKDLLKNNITICTF